MLFSLFILDFPFNGKFNGVFKNTYNKNDVSVIASSSWECHSTSLANVYQTKPESVFDPDDKFEWCSKFNQSKTDYPWIATIFKDKTLTLSGYSIRTGCCDTYTYCCSLYSWSLLGSNDNKTWTKLHSMKKYEDFKNCKIRSFPVDKNGSFSMFKIVQEEPEPNCWYCMVISKIEFYGSFKESNNKETTYEDEISIIGRLKNV